MQIRKESLMSLDLFAPHFTQPFTVFECWSHSSMQLQLGRRDVHNEQKIEYMMEGGTKSSILQKQDRKGKMQSKL